VFCCLSRTGRDLPSVQLHQSVTSHTSTVEQAHPSTGNRRFYPEVKRPKREPGRVFFSNSTIGGSLIHC